MTEWRFQCAVGFSCALFTAIACGGSDEATGKDKPGLGTTAGSGGQAGGPAQGSGGNPINNGTGGSSASSSSNAGQPNSGLECDGSEPIECDGDDALRGCGTNGQFLTVTCEEYCTQSPYFDAGACLPATEEFEADCDCQPQNVPCYNGSAILYFCYRDVTAEQALAAYESCVEEFMDARPVLNCFAKYWPESIDENTTLDCEAADAECFPDVETGAGGEGGQSSSTSGAGGSGGTSAGGTAGTETDAGASSD